MNGSAGPVKGLIIAAPSSGSGKTVITLGLLRHLSVVGKAITSAKAGPDYIDPAFHSAATGMPCQNLDIWAMRPSLLHQVASNGSDGATVVCEGVMGLFDGAVMEQGSTADLSEATGWPVVLIIDAAAQGASAGAVLRGFATHRPNLLIAGVIFNRVGGVRHKSILEEAATQAAPDVKILGFVPRSIDLNLPDRHLGLIQAVEHPDLEKFINSAASVVEKNIDIDEFLSLAQPLKLSRGVATSPIAPLGQRIAVADDEAFSFRYPIILDGWKNQGAELSFFSPLNDQAPSRDVDAVYLPGGYPELYCHCIASSSNFMLGLKQAKERGAAVFGECGGFMVLGKGLIDMKGKYHPMVGLLPLETSFAQRKLHLGYREVELDAEAARGAGGVLGSPGQRFRGHEFHYATIHDQSAGRPLFHSFDAAGNGLGTTGLADGRVMGSFIHLIDRKDC